MLCPVHGVSCQGGGGTPVLVLAVREIYPVLVLAGGEGTPVLVLAGDRYPCPGRGQQYPYPKA